MYITCTPFGTVLPRSVSQTTSGLFFQCGGIAIVDILVRVAAGTPRRADEERQLQAPGGAGIDAAKGHRRRRQEWRVKADMPAFARHRQDLLSGLGGRKSQQCGCG
jgi:hypothetical protein